MHRDTSSRATTSCALWFALVLSACGPEAPSASFASAQVEDSAGIRIVSVRAQAPSDTLRPDLLWDYGAEPPDYLFQRIGFGVVRDDGYVVIADAGSDEVVAIDSLGDTHQVVARTGQGPSEVRSPRQIVTFDGSEVWVEDVSGGKLLRLVSDSVVDVLTGSANPSVAPRLMPIGVDPLGQLLLTTGGHSTNFDEPWLLGTLAVLDPGQSHVDTVGTFQFTPRVGEPPISPFTGYGVITVAGGRFVTARTDIPELRWRSADGSITQISRWTAQLDYPDDQDWQEFRASIRAGFEGMTPGRPEAEYDQVFERAISGWHLDESQPVRLFDDIIGSESGGVWVAPFTPARTSPPSTTDWIVFSPGGDRVGVAQFDRPTRVLHVNESRILGIHTDDLDLETVVVYQNPFGM